MPESSEVKIGGNPYVERVTIPETPADWQKLKQGLKWVDEYYTDEVRVTRDPELRRKAELLRSQPEELRKGNAHIVYAKHQQAVGAYKFVLDNIGQNHLARDAEARVINETQGRGRYGLNPDSLDESLYRQRAPSGLAFVASKLEDSLVQAEDPTLQREARKNPNSDAAVRLEGLKAWNKFMIEIALGGLGQYKLVELATQRATDRSRLAYSSARS